MEKYGAQYRFTFYSLRSCLTQVSIIYDFSGAKKQLWIRYKLKSFFDLAMIRFLKLLRASFNSNFFNFRSPTCTGDRSNGIQQFVPRASVRCIRRALVPLCTILVHAVHIVLARNDDQVLGGRARLHHQDAHSVLHSFRCTACAANHSHSLAQFHDIKSTAISDWQVLPIFITISMASLNSLFAQPLHTCW